MGWRLGVALVWTIVIAGHADALAGLASTPTAGGQSAGGVARDLTLDVAGQTRRYRLYIPARVARNPAAVIVFHGGGGDGPSIEQKSGFDRIADTAGLLAVYPNGTPEAPFSRGNQWLRNGNAANDLLFIRHLIDALTRDQHADPRRIFVAGLSNGGLMAYAVACTMGDEIAAVGAVATTMGSLLAQAATCRPGRPIPIIHIHSDADPLVPFNGGRSALPDRIGSNLPSVQETIDFWVRNNGCRTTPDRSRAGVGDVVSVERFPGCDDGADVQLDVIQDGSGHGWPGSPPDPLGDRSGFPPPSQTIDATEVIWGFFADHGADGSS